MLSLKINNEPIDLNESCPQSLMTGIAGVAVAVSETNFHIGVSEE